MSQMPQKDPEAYRNYKREQMRQRRAAAKSQVNPPGASSPQDSGSPATLQVPSLTVPPPPATLNPDEPLAKAAAPAPVKERPPRSYSQAGAKHHPDQPRLPFEEESPQEWCIVRANRWNFYPHGEGFIYPYDFESSLEKQGFPCFKGPGRCCLPLRHETPRYMVDDCVFRPEYCIYFREVIQPALV